MIDCKFSKILNMQVCIFVEGGGMMKRSARFGVDALRCPVLVKFAIFEIFEFGNQKRALGGMQVYENRYFGRETKIVILDAKRRISSR